MSDLVHQLIEKSACRRPAGEALVYRTERCTYADLWSAVGDFARGLVRSKIARGERVALYLEKRPEAVITVFGVAYAGSVFVPVNPLLRPRQVGYILRDCNVRFLVTSRDRLSLLAEELAHCPELGGVVVVDANGERVADIPVPTFAWSDFVANGKGSNVGLHRIIDTDMAAILYTSGSTGAPKGVVLSHRNIVCGAKSVSQYMENNEDDIILAVLPLSFDAGFSQLTTAFRVGARAILMNYLLASEVVRLCAREAVTGITAVPPLWTQLAQLEWPADAAANVRYFANTGGHMPRPVLDRLRRRLPNAKPFLMYGLTEAFRSTYLDPAEVDSRIDFIGKAIPNNEILVVKPDGTPCSPGEEGELVHRGALVAMGYWNDPQRTAERFRAAPGQPAGLPLAEIAVWSGDVVKQDEDGFIYFVGRSDEMIKTSGYRVSPTEIEDVIYASGLVQEAVAIGVPHPVLGQGIVVVAVARQGLDLDIATLSERCRMELPLYMVPGLIAERPTLPRNPNGKIDRPLLTREFAETYVNVQP